MSKVSRSIASRGHAPFATTLRPNLTGGALPRRAGNYSLGGIGGSGVRNFSSAPVCQAQVVNNVSAAVRAFWISGQKTRFDGVDGKTGEKRWRAVSKVQDKTSRMMAKAKDSKQMKGTTLEFSLNPTITALSAVHPAKATSLTASNTLDSFTDAEEQSLNTPGLLNGLAGNFARALKDLSAVLADLNRLRTLGDLPVSLIDSGSTLAVHFPGCDARSVELLCSEVGVQRGIIREDPMWRADKSVEMALLFPFAPSRDESVSSASAIEQRYFESALPKPERVDWTTMLSPKPSSPERTRTITTSPRFSTKSVTSDEEDVRPVDVESLDTFLQRNTPEILPFSGSEEGFESLRDSDYDENDELISTRPVEQEQVRSHDASIGSQEDFQGVQGIYKFLVECEGARRT